MDLKCSEATLKTTVKMFLHARNLFFVGRKLYTLTNTTLCKHVHIIHATLLVVQTVLHTQTQTSQLSLYAQSDIMCSTCLLRVISMHTQHIRQTPRADTSSLFPAHMPNICSCSDMGLNDGTTFQSFSRPSL